MKYRVGQKGNRRSCCVNILLNQFMLNYFVSLSSRPKPAVRNNVLGYSFFGSPCIAILYLSPKRKVEFVFLFKCFMPFFDFILLIWTESGPIMSGLVWLLYCMTSSLLLQLYFLPLKFLRGFVVSSDNYWYALESCLDPNLFDWSYFGETQFKTVKLCYLSWTEGAQVQKEDALPLKIAQSKRFGRFLLYLVHFQKII